jgi:carbonic anhydrase
MADNTAHTTERNDTREVPLPSYLSRRHFIQNAGVAGLGATAGVAVGPVAVSEATESRPTTGQQALGLLLAGNRRWVTGRVRHPHQSIKRRMSLTRSQSPFAVVFSCIDSRVPPELVFDRGLGDMFVIRTGAQTVDDVTLGSVEFGPEENGTPLILVLGHQRCGAVIAAIDVIQHHGHGPGHIQAVVNALKPAYNVAVHQSGDLVDNTVRAQTKLTVALLKRDPVLAERVHAGELMIVGGRYSLGTGRVEIIA